MSTVILVRHGETEWNLQRRVQGATDIPLNDTGRQQAEDAARYLASVLSGSSRLAVASSDLRRAHETACVIARLLGVDAPLTHPGVRERSYGDAEGVTDDEFIARWGSFERAVVPGAESDASVCARSLPALRELAMRAGPEHEESTLIVVTHGGVIAALVREAIPSIPPGGPRIANGSAHRFEVSESDVTYQGEMSAGAPHEGASVS